MADDPQTTGGIQMTLFDRRGEVSVFLHAASGDHIVIRYYADKVRGEFAHVLPYGSERWDQAVRRAERASAFVLNPICP